MNPNQAQPQDPTQPQDFEYLKVEVTRTESTDLYLKVPKGWRPSWGYGKMMAKAAKETTTESDWDGHDLEQTIEIQGHGPVEAEEALDYSVFDVVEYLKSRREGAQ
jgi:hypothetical protein